MNRKFFDEYRSLSDIELQNLLSEPQEDFIPEARMILLQVAYERGISMDGVNDNPSARKYEEEYPNVRIAPYCSGTKEYRGSIY